MARVDAAAGRSGRLTAPQAQCARARRWPLALPPPSLPACASSVGVQPAPGNTQHQSGGLLDRRASHEIGKQGLSPEMRRRHIQIGAGVAMALATPAAALPPPASPSPATVSRVPIITVTITPANVPRTAAPPMARPMPPLQGAKRCIGVNTVAGAVVFGDSAVELTMKSGKRWRLYFAQRCPTLNFYSGFYYRRAQAGVLCAGKDSVISRAGGECAIASIMPVRSRPAPKPRQP